MLAVGFADGKMNVLKMKPEAFFITFEEVATLKHHKNRINGIEFDKKKGNIYSAGEDSKFLISDLSH